MFIKLLINILTHSRFEFKKKKNIKQMAIFHISYQRWRRCTNVDIILHQYFPYLVVEKLNFFL